MGTWAFELTQYHSRAPFLKHSPVTALVSSQAEQSLFPSLALGKGI